ncbi:uncharacterized protein [Mytilus edulis]|uniref:uncharacterized protein n=1 Tax=Mytilus edulis TaxID=6550 RepID=UPI0039EFC75C
MAYAEIMPVSSSLKSSDTKCGPCDVREKNNPSLYWCMSCEEGLCAECYDHHRAIKSSRNHSVVPLENFKPLEQFISSFITDCSIHDSPLELYCPCHEEPCCTKCAALSHKDCLGITLFHTFIHNLKKSVTVEDLEKELGNFVENIDTLIKNRKMNMKELENQSETKFDLYQLRKEIDDHLKNLEVKLQSKYQRLHIASKAEIQAIVEKLQDKRKLITAYKDNLSQLTQIGTDTQMFHGTKQIEKIIKDEVKALTEIVNDSGMHEIKIKSNRNNIQFESIALISELVDVTVERESCKVVLKDMSIGSKCQNVKDNETEVSVVEKIQTEFDKSLFLEDANICTLKVLQNGDIAVVDAEFNQIIIFNINGSIERAFDLPDRPFGLTIVDANTVAVSFPEICRIKVYLLDDTFTEVDEIETGDECWGLQFEDDLFIAAIRNVEIVFLKLSGNVHKTFPMQQKNLVYVFKNQQRHFRTEFENNTVHCYSSTNGRKLWQFSHPTVLGPRNMCSDDKGNLFVACLESDCVILISSDGKKFKRVVEMRSAKCICFDGKNSILYVCSETGSEMASFIIPKDFGSF